MPLKDRAGLNQAQPGLPSAPGLRKPGPKNPVQRRQAWSFGAPAQHEQLVSQGQDLQEQVPARFQPGNGQVKHERQPTNHAAEDSGKCLRSPVFSTRMRFLPTTGGGDPPFLAHKRRQPCPVRGSGSHAAYSMAARDQRLLDHRRRHLRDSARHGGQPEVFPVAHPLNAGLPTGANPRSIKVLVSVSPARHAQRPLADRNQTMDDKIRSVEAKLAGR